MVAENVMSFVEWICRSEAAPKDHVKVRELQRYLQQLLFLSTPLTEAGEPGAPMGPAVLHVVEEQELKLDPVTIHSHNMVVKPAEDQPRRVRDATQTHVQ